MATAHLDAGFPAPVTGGPGLTRYTGYLLRRVYARSLDCERSCMPVDAGLREVAVLAMLDQQGPTSQRELGAVLHVNRSVMVKVVDALEERGWVVRERNPEDRRSYALRLTAAGATALRDARADLERLERDLTAELDDSERGALARHLRALLAEEPVIGIDRVGDVTAFLVMHAHRALRERAQAAFAELGIDPRDFGILTVIEAEQPCPQVLVAARIGVTPPAVQGAIEALVDRGLVRRTTNAADRRLHDLSLTDEGKACLAEARSSAASVQERVTATLGSSAESELRDLLSKLIA